MKREFDIVEVEWLDAQSGFGSAFDIEEFAEAFEVCYTHSIGYLINESKDWIVLGFMIFGEWDRVKHWQLIPKGMIKKINKLK